MAQTMTIEKEKSIDEVLETFASKLEKKVDEIINASEKSVPKSLLSELENSGIVYNGKILHDIGHDIYVEPETGNHYKFINGKFEEIKMKRLKPDVYVVEMEE